MKFTYTWLLSHLETTATPTEVSEKLTALGLEVDDFIDLGKKYEPFLVAEILEAEKHPNADKLRVCKVNNGTEVIQIVCGAPNARAGIKVCLAPVGAMIPNGNFQIKKSKIRDVESNGMLCSATELELGSDSEGIMELGADAKVGSKYADYAALNDCFYEINITPNRADCLGVRGIARDLAAAGMGKLKPLTPRQTSHAYIGVPIKGVTNKPSPEWLQTRLKSIGLNPISALVDITNFITFDLGRPLHVYDADKLNGGLKVEGQRSKASFNALNGKTYELSDELVVADDKGAVALAGVIGNVETSVDLNTKNIFLEVAYFDPAEVAKSGRKHQIDSDARYRFERGVDPDFLESGAEIAVKLITEVCGGTAGEAVKFGAKTNTTKEITFDFGKLKSFGGIDISTEAATKILTDLGFTVNGNKITTPSWRADIDGTSDIVEEVLRVHGYDKIPAQVIPFKTAARLPQFATNRNAARQVLASLGLTEAVTYSFLDIPTAASFGGGNSALQLANPISADLAEMRPSIIPNLLQAIARNANRGFKNIGLFEIGTIFGAKEQTSVGGVRAGKNAERNIYGDYRNIDVFDAKADLQAVLKAANAPEGRILTDNIPSYYHPSRSGGIFLGKNCLGYFGEIHPSILKKIDITGAVAAFEVFLDNIPASQKKYKKVEISDFQSVNRDFAFVVATEVNSDDLVANFKKADPLITAVNIFDIYVGDKLEKGKKSVALSVNIQPKDKTLTDTEIEAICKKIIDSTAAKFGASLRA